MVNEYQLKLEKGNKTISNDMKSYSETQYIIKTGKRCKLNKKDPIVSLQKEEKIDEMDMHEEKFINFAKKQSNNISLEKYETISTNHIKTKRQKCKTLKKYDIFTLNKNGKDINSAGKKFTINHFKNDCDFSHKENNVLLKSKTREKYKNKFYAYSKNNENLGKISYNANLNNCDKNSNTTKHLNKNEIMYIKDNKLDITLNESQNKYKAEDSANDGERIKNHKRCLTISNTSKLTKACRLTNTFVNKHSKYSFKKSTENKSKNGKFFNNNDLKVNDINQGSLLNVNKRKANFENHCKTKKVKSINENNLELNNFEIKNKKENGLKRKIYNNRHDYSNNNNCLQMNKSEKIREVKSNSEYYVKNIADKNSFKRETKERLSRTLFVGNLPLDTTTKDMKILFEKFGKIESVRQRGLVPLKPNMPKKVASIKKKYSPSIHSINGYIVFEKTEDAKKALALNGTLFHNHHIRVDQVIKKNNFIKNKSIFIGNLPFDIEEEKVWTHFGQCGCIKSVRIIRDKQTGLGKGFGYILFENENSVKKALRLKIKAFCDRNLRIQPIKNVQKCKSKLKPKSTQQYKIFKSKAHHLRKKFNLKSKKTLKKMIKKQKSIYDKKQISLLFNK